MNTTVLTLHRPAHERWLANVCERLAQWQRARATRAALRALDSRLLRDIGIDAGLIASLEAETQQRDVALRVHLDALH